MYTEQLNNDSTLQKAIAQAQAAFAQIVKAKAEAGHSLRLATEADAEQAKAEAKAEHFATWGKHWRKEAEAAEAAGLQSEKHRRRQAEAEAQAKQWQATAQAAQRQAAGLHSLADIDKSRIAKAKECYALCVRLILSPAQRQAQAEAKAKAEAQATEAKAAKEAEKAEQWRAFCAEAKRRQAEQAEQAKAEQAEAVAYVQSAFSGVWPCSALRFLALMYTQRKAQAKAQAHAEAGQGKRRLQREAERQAKAQAKASKQAKQAKAAEAAEAAGYRPPQYCGKMPHTQQAAGKLTAEQAEAKGLYVIAKRLLLGTMTEAEAAQLSTNLDCITGNDFTSWYIAEQSGKAANIALHIAENYSGGLPYLSNLSKQAEAVVAKHTAAVATYERQAERQAKAEQAFSKAKACTAWQYLAKAKAQAEQAKAKAQAIAPQLGTWESSCADVFDTVQAAGLAICEHGQVMTAERQSYSETHRPAIAAAKAYSQKQSNFRLKEYAPDFQTMDRAKSTEAQALAEAEADADTETEQGFTLAEAAEAEAQAQAETEAAEAKTEAQAQAAEEKAYRAAKRRHTQAIKAEAEAQALLIDVADTEAQALAAKIAGKQGLFAVDLVQVLIHWQAIAEAAGFDDDTAAGMPNNTQLAQAMATEAAGQYMTQAGRIYCRSRSEKTVREKISHTLKRIATDAEAAKLSFYLRQAIAEQATGKRLIVA